MFHCYIHNYKTINPYRWDKHCYDKKHELIIWKNGKEKTIPYPKNYMFKRLNYYGMNDIYIKLYCRSREKQKH